MNELWNRDMREATVSPADGRLTDATALAAWRALHSEGITFPPLAVPPKPPPTIGLVGLESRRTGRDVRHRLASGRNSGPRISPAGHLGPRIPWPARGSGCGRWQKQSPGRRWTIVREGKRSRLARVLQQSGRHPRLQALCAERVSRQPLPLIVMLHGCTQSPDDFAGRHGYELARRRAHLPCRLSRPGRSVGQHLEVLELVPPGDQQRGQGGAFADAGITRAGHRTRYYGQTGVGSMSPGFRPGRPPQPYLAATYSEIYAAIGVHSGLACGAAHDVPSALAAMSRTWLCGAWGRRSGAVWLEAVALRTRRSSFTAIGTRRLIPTTATSHRPASGSAEPRLQETVQQGRVAGGHAYSRIAV